MTSLFSLGRAKSSKKEVQAPAKEAPVAAEVNALPMAALDSAAPAAESKTSAVEGTPSIPSKPTDATLSSIEQDEINVQQQEQSLESVESLDEDDISFEVMHQYDKADPTSSLLVARAKGWMLLLTSLGVRFEAVAAAEKTLAKAHASIAKDWKSPSKVLDKAFDDDSGVKVV